MKNSRLWIISAGSANVCSNVPAPTDTGCGTYDGTSSCCTQQNPCNKGEGDCDQVKYYS